MNKMPRQQYRYNSRPNDLYSLGTPAYQQTNISPYGPQPRAFLPNVMPMIQHCADNPYNINRFPAPVIDHQAGNYYTSPSYKSNQSMRSRGGGGGGGYRVDTREKNREISPSTGNGKGRSVSPGSVSGARASSSDAQSSSASYQGHGHSLSRTNLYIRGLPPHTTDQDLQQLCQEFGRIISTKAIIEPQTQTCKGFGFVDFETCESAERAVVELGARGVQVQMAKQQQERDVTNLYVANLPFTMTEADLHALFGQYGPVVSTRILRDSGGSSRGVGFARMENREACDTIINMFNGKLLSPGGNMSDPLTVKYADGMNKKRSPQSNNSESTSNRQWMTCTPDSVCSTGAAASSLSTLTSHPPQVLTVYDPQQQQQHQQQQQQQPLHQIMTTPIYNHNGMTLPAILSPVGAPQGYATSPVLINSSYLTSPQGVAAIPGPSGGAWVTIPHLQSAYAPIPGPQHAALLPAGPTMIPQTLGTAGASTFILHPVGALPATLISGGMPPGVHPAVTPVYHPSQQLTAVDPTSLLVMSNHSMANHQLVSQMSQLHIAQPAAAVQTVAAADNSGPAAVDEHSSHANTSAAAV